MAPDQEVNSSRNFTADFNQVPVETVHKENLSEKLPSLLSDIQSCSFLAVDCELSGLGDRKKLNAGAIDERYRNTCLVAKTRSIISLGLSMFKLVPKSEENANSCSSWDYAVKSYNLLVLCSEDYIVEPGSLQFLVQHGFDFSAQYALGIGYNRGNDSEDEKERTKQSLRQIFSEIVKAGKPLVLHNGLIDLIFMYHNLWTALPPKLDTFISDVSQMFPAGVYDTKYVADYVARTQASYLEFVFRKEWRANMEKCDKNRPHVKVEFEEYSNDDPDIDIRDICGDAADVDTESGTEVCSSFANHGHCPIADTCQLSHDIDLIVSKKAAEQDKKWRKRKNCDNENNSGNKVPKLDKALASNGESKSSSKESSIKIVKAGGHRAGYDAFMTGFSLATFLVHHTQIPLSPQSWLAPDLKTEKIVNKIYLVSKDFPLLLQKSAFAKCSIQHDAKMKRLGLIESD